MSIIKSFDPNFTKHITIIPDQPSSYSVVLSPENQDRTFLHCPGTNDTFGQSGTPYELLEKYNLSPDYIFKSVKKVLKKK